MTYDDGNKFKGGAGYFLTQKDGHNCGPIACLKFMEIYDFIDMDVIEKNRGKNGSSYRQLVYKQHHMCLVYLKDEIIVNARIKKDDIQKECDVLCVCKGNIRHNTMTSRVLPCCNAIFSDECVTDFLEKYSWCPFCGEECKKNDKVLSTVDYHLKIDDELTELLPTNVYKNEEVRENDAVRKESAEKKRKFQEKQGQKMEKRYKETMKERGSNISFGDVVTVWVDPRVASHARGVVAIVVNSKESGGILACADGGCIVNGKTKKEWWIASDGYELKARKDEPVTLSPTLAEVQRQVIGGIFSWVRHRKCSLADAHKETIGASSPCLRSNCHCKGGKCTKRCGCYRNGRACSSTCACSGKCTVNEMNDI